MRQLKMTTNRLKMIMRQLKMILRQLKMILRQLKMIIGQLKMTTNRTTIQLKVKMTPIKKQMIPNAKSLCTNLTLELVIPLKLNLTIKVARSVSSQRVLLNYKIWPHMAIDSPSDNTIVTQAIYADDSTSVRLISLTVTMLITLINTIR